MRAPRRRREIALSYFDSSITNSPTRDAMTCRYVLPARLSFADRRCRSFRSAQRLDPRVDDVDRQGKNHRRVLFDANLSESLQIAELNRRRLGRQYFGGVR